MYEYMINAIIETALNSQLFVAGGFMAVVLVIALIGSKK